MNENFSPSGTPGAEDAPTSPAAEEIVIDPELEAIANLLVQAGQAVEVPAGFHARLENQLLRARAAPLEKSANVGIPPVRPPGFAPWA